MNSSKKYSTKTETKEDLKLADVKIAECTK